MLCCYFSLRPLTDVEGGCGRPRRDEQGNLAQSIGCDGWQLSPGCVTAGDDADRVAFRQAQEFVFFRIERLDEEGEVDEAVREFLFDCIGIARKEFTRNAWLFPPQFGKGVRQEVYDRCFAGADADTARQFRLVVADFGFRLLDEGYDFLSPLAQADAFFREQRTAVGPDEELFAQFLFQIGHLPG